MSSKKETKQGRSGASAPKKAKGKGPGAERNKVAAGKKSKQQEGGPGYRKGGGNHSKSARKGMKTQEGGPRNGNGGTDNKKPMRKAWLEKLRCEDEKLNNPGDVQRFLDKLVELGKKPEELALEFNEKLLKVLRHAIQLLLPSIHPIFGLLQRLGEESLKYGIYGTNTLACFWTLFEVCQKQLLKSVQEKGTGFHAAVGWFLLRLVMSEEHGKVVRESGETRRLCEFLQRSPEPGAAKIARNLGSMIGIIEGRVDKEAPRSLASAKVTSEVPPGRREHDNDKENFQDVEIFPTCKELLSQEDAYLPFPLKCGEGSEYVPCPKLATIDRQFRLLREDFIGTIKEELQVELSRPSEERRRTFEGVRFMGLGLEPVPHVVVRIAMPRRLAGRLKKLKPKDRQEFFENGPGRRVLPRNSLVMLATTTKNSKSEVCVNKITALGTVVERSGMVTDGQPEMQVGVCFTPQSLVAISPLLDRVEIDKKGVRRPEVLFCSSVGMFDFEPVLRALKGMDDIELSEALVDLKDIPVAVGALAHAGCSFREIPSSIRKAVETDQMQKLALEKTLTQSVVLVQGPPGTGKTYVGVQMVKTMLELEKRFPDPDRAPLRILCLCYTNHALDSFLLDLIKNGVSKEDIIRAGGSSKIHNDLQDRTLRKVATGTRSTADKKAEWTIRTEIDTLTEELKRIRQELNRSQWGKADSWWVRTVSDWLADEHHSQWKQLCVPNREKDGFRVVGGGGKEITKGYLWERWCENKDRGVFKGDEFDQKGVWGLNKKEREKERTKWNEEWALPKRTEFLRIMMKLGQCRENLTTLRRHCDCRALQNTKIIGCTTVGAANLRGLLKPSVILVEEAGEILEAHVLVNLSKDTRQLILIGDHKQLRPKVSKYALDKASGKGFDLNVSLFERLVIENFPVVCLSVQHRMRPEISDIIREMGLYPSIVDASGTKGRPNVVGVTKNVVFLDHQNAEDNSEEMEILGSKTKLNTFEARLVVAIANHLVSQGQHKHQDITILTPYVGQLALILDELARREIRAEVGDLDSADLARAQETGEVMMNRPTPVQSTVGGTFRVATIDNYQGEESNIIVASLVRSGRGGIGFIAQAERINVLLSRAREGMFLVGNFNTLSSGSKVWRDLRERAQRGGFLLDHFPAKCETHKSVLKLQCAESFEELAPRGGCKEKCNERLSCGHSCPLDCHPPLQKEMVHSQEGLCVESVSDLCGYGHSYLRKCSDEKVICEKLATWKCPRGHTLKGECRKGRPTKCRTCDKIAKAEKEELAKHMRAQENEVEESVPEMPAVETKIEKATAEKKEENPPRTLEQVQLEQKIHFPPAHAPSEGKGDIENESSKPSSKSVEEIEEGQTERVDVTETSSSPASSTESAVWLEKTRFEADVNFMNALKCFKLEKFLEASDKLDLVKAVDERTTRALGCLIGLELGSPPSEPMEFPGLVTSTETALQCWASFESLVTEFPALAKTTAEKLERFLDSNSPVSQFPTDKARQRIADVTSFEKIAEKKEEGPMDPNTVLKKKWKQILKKDADAPAIMIDVLKMIGLQAVKREMIDQYNQIKLAKKQGDSGLSSYNARFEGNPGTGKTTIARHYSSFLRQLKVLPPEARSVELTAASLINEGVKHLDAELEKVKKAGGGVIFVDEAYQLGSDAQGKKILDYILPFAESLHTKFGKVVWIFAGYEKDMERLFEHNEGLPSRFPVRFKFEDYTAVELGLIFKSLLEYQDVASSSTPNKRTQQSNNNGGSYNNLYSPQLAPYSSARYYQRGSKIYLKQQNDEEEEDEIQPAASKTSKRRQTPFTCDSNDARIAMERLARRGGRPGFGNARAVRTFFDEVRKRQAARLGDNPDGSKEDPFRFVRSDLLGQEPNLKQMQGSPAYKSLQKMLGMQPVKDKIDQLMQMVVANARREKEGKKLQEVVLNRIFLGNPGTGKTTVAKIYGKLLAELGLLSKGEVVIKFASDFKGEVIGESEKTTRSILRASEGCVLVIDEAYSLCSSNGISGGGDPYGQAIIDTLVEQIQARPGDDRAVILLGYEDQMRQMLKNCNPGLSRRFQLENAFHFPDFNDAELVKLLLMKAKEQDLEVSLAVAKRAVRMLAKARAKPNFGNGGAVDTLLSKAIQQKQTRDPYSSRLTPEDFGHTGDALDEETLNGLFDDLIGIQGVRNNLDEKRKVVLMYKASGKSPLEVVGFNYLFTGNPGTGKTTVAKLMGKMYHTLGLLASDTVHVHPPSDFSTGFVGQAAKKTREILDMCRGEVLFIDEAYQLDPTNGGAFMREVLDELCGALTEPKYQNKILVILAGYADPIDRMIQVNPGLRSRFTERVHFDDFDVDAILNLIKLWHKKGEIPLDIPEDLLRDISKRLSEIPDFSNGRDVINFCTFADRERAKSWEQSKDQVPSTTRTHLEAALEKLIRDRPVPNGQPTFPGTQLLHVAQNTAPPPFPPPTRITTKHTTVSQEKELEMAPQSQEQESGDDSEPPSPFANIDREGLKHMNDIVDEMNLNSAEGILKLRKLGPEFRRLAKELSRRLGRPSEDILKAWQEAHDEVERLRAQSKDAALVAIWHCSACGAGGYPTPVCYFAPYISGFIKVENE